MSYTEAMTQLIIEEYTADPCRSTVDRLAEELDKPVRSIIAKLSCAGIYKAAVKLDKTGEPVSRKEDLARDIGKWFGIDVPSIAKASKLELKALHEALSNPDYVRAHLVDLDDLLAQ